MPLYIYICPNCKKKHELFKHKFQQKAICPDCEKKGEAIQMKLHPDSFKTADNPFKDITWFKHQ